MKHSLSLIILFFSLSGFSQLEKGAKFLDGYSSYSFFRYQDDPNILNQSNVFLNSTLNFGTALSSKTILILGLNTELESRSFEYNSFDPNSGDFIPITSTQDESVNSVLIGVEKYLKLKEKIYFTTVFSASIGLGKYRRVESTIGDMERDLFRYSFSITPRIQYFLNDKWAITGGIGSIFFKQTLGEIEGVEEKSKETEFRSNLGLNTFGLGVRFYLNNSSK